MSVQCPKCSKSYDVLPKFCTQCGTSLKTCQQCQSPLAAEQNFCNQCGASQSLAGTQYGSVVVPVQSVVNTPKKGKTPKKIAFATAFIALIVAIAFLGNQFLWPLIQNRSTTRDNDNEQTEQTLDEKDNLSSSIEGIVSDENLEIATESQVKMILSPLAIKGETTAKIQPYELPSPADHITLVMYDFSLETDVPLDGIVTLEIPYEPSLIPDGYTPEQCLVGVYYNEAEALWEDTHYRIDTERHVVIIKTEHLSPFGYGLNTLPMTQPTSGGTVDLGSNQIFTPNNTWIDAPNFGVFYTDPIHSRYERAYKYHLETAKAKSAEQNLDAVMEQISIYGLDSPNQVLMDSGASFLGTLEGYPEHLGTATMFFEIYKSERFELWNTRLSNLGGAVALFQLASDMYYEKPMSSSVFTFLKGMTYWKGAAAAELLLGLTAGSYFSIALVALFFVEQLIGPMESWNENAYSKQPEHMKLFGAYQSYYDTRPANGGLYRSIRDWSDIIDELNQKALTDPNLGEEQRDTFFAKLLKEEVENYVQAFWNLPVEDKATKVIANKSGFLYGKWGLIHYEGGSTDSDILVSDYVDKIRNNEVKGMSLTLAEAQSVKLDAGSFLTVGPASNLSSATSYLNFFDTQGGIYDDIKKEMTSAMYNYVINQRIQPLMSHKREANYISRENTLKKNLEVIMSDLNTMLVLNYIGSSEEEPISLYPEHIVVPMSDVLKTKGTLADWAVTLDKSGNGSLDFTTLAHLQAGGFKQIGIYAPEDKDKLDTAAPVAVIDFVIENTTTDIVLDELKFPTLAELAGTWTDATIIFTRLEMSEEFKQMLQGMGEEWLQEAFAGCEVEAPVNSDGEVIIDDTTMGSFIGKVFPAQLTILAAGTDNGTFTFQQYVTEESDDFQMDPAEIPFQYTEGILKGSLTLDGASLTLDMAASYDSKNSVKVVGIIAVNYGEGMLEIDMSIEGTKTYVPTP